MTQAELERMLADKIKNALEEQRVVITAAVQTEIEAKIKEFYAKQPPPDKKVTASDGGPAETEKRFKTFGDMLVAVREAAYNPSKVDDRLVKAPSGIGEATPSEGGFLVQADFSAELIKRTHDRGILASKCRRVPISNPANRIIINAVDEKSRKNGRRWGGIQVYWTDEAAIVTASKPTFRQIELKLNKLTGAYYATEEELEDTVALESLCMEAFSEEFAFKVDDAILWGKGGGQPQGVLLSNARIAVAKEIGQAADTLVFENFKKMRNRIHPANRMNAGWYINVDCEPEMDGMTIVVGTGGIPVYLPAGGLSTEPYNRMYGKPVIPIEQAAALGDEGDVIYADFTDYLLAEKKGMAAAESVHVRFLYGENTYRFVYRCDGQLKWNAPLEPYKGSTTTSPIVTLAARA